MNTVFDFAPLWRSGIGFDHVVDMLGQAASAKDDKYPPYDIEKTGEDAYRLTLAIAGWTPDKITVTAEPNVLVVSGQQPEPEGKEYLHRGDSRRWFRATVQPCGPRTSSRGTDE